MWSRAGPRSSVLDRAKAQLSGQRISDTGSARNNRDVENPGKHTSSSEQRRFQELQDVVSPSEREDQEPVKTTPPEGFSLGGGSRFLKKTSVGDRLSSARTGSPAGTGEAELIPQRSSQSVALSRLAHIESRLRHQKNKSDAPSLHTNSSGAQETRASVRSSSDLSATGRRFLTKSTASAAQEDPGPSEHGSDSDEQDMRRLLGDSFSLSEGSPPNAVRKKSPQPVKKSLKSSSEKSSAPSPAPERHKVFGRRSPAPALSRPESRSVRFTERSESSGTGHSEIRSLDDLFPAAAPLDSDDTLSDRSAASDDFKLNVMTLDDLVALPPEAAEASQHKKETRVDAADGKKKSSSSVISKGASLAPEDFYESDFESEVPSESAAEVSEHLSDGHRDTSLVSEVQDSSFTSQEGDDDDDERASSQSSSHSRGSDSSSGSGSSRTVTHGPSPEPHVKEAAVQTQTHGLTYTWSSGEAAVGPSLGMTYVDPAPIASHTVSAEAIESLTAYSPAVRALNDMLRQQLSLTRAFLDSTRRHYTSVIQALGPADYKYTTLQDTREFIRAHRPPKLRIEDALEEVLQEMRDYHYS